MRDTPKRATYLYLLLTLLFSAAIWILVIWSGHLGMGFGLMIPAVMWCPTLAALVTCRLLGRKFRSLAWRWPNGRYVAAAYFVPLAYAAIAYGGVWGVAAGRLEFGIRQPGCAAFRSEGLACLGIAHALHSLYGHWRHDAEPLDSARRRDWLARFPGT